MMEYVRVYQRQALRADDYIICTVQLIDDDDGPGPVADKAPLLPSKEM